MIEPRWWPTNRELRRFALVAPPGFGTLALVVWWKFGWALAAETLAVVGVLVGVCGLVLPAAVLPVYWTLMAVAVPIGRVVSNLALCVIYYGVFAIVGLGLRLAGRDALRLRQPRVRTYWRPTNYDMDMPSYFRQS